MKIKLAIILLGLCGLCFALLSAPIEARPPVACPDSVICSIDGGTMPLVQRYSGPPRAVYAHTYFGEYHSVQIACD